MSESPTAIPLPGHPWTDDEIDVAISEYLIMLRLQLSGTTFVKVDHRRHIKDQLPARTNASIELKWCNLSAVLNEMGLPWVHGYVPRAHYQRKLKDVVVRRITDEWLLQGP